MLKRYLPILTWLPQYNRAALVSDLVAAVIVTLLLIPQSLAYALLAGLPAEMGLYASILPLAAYSLLGSSRTLAVGPVAIIALMTAAGAGTVATQGSPEYITAAITLALLSGVLLSLMGLLRLGFMANFLSHPVISGFVTASALIIALGQTGPLLGLTVAGSTLPELTRSLLQELPSLHWPTLAVGLTALAILLWSRHAMARSLRRLGMSARTATLASKAGPVLAVLMTSAAVWRLDLSNQGVRVVGEISGSLPALIMPSVDLALWKELFIPALLISIVGFVESVSVAQTLAAKRRQRIDPDQELIGLGSANLAAAFSGGYPVTGGFARSVVNFDAGAETPAAGAFTAVGIALAALFLTPFLASLPIAVLAATIIVAVLSLVDLKTPFIIWRYSKSDFSAMAATILITLILGVESGVIAGVLLSLALFLWRSSRPHAVVVGRVPGTEHFRNIERHKVITLPHLLMIRIDESLTYLNARWLEEYVLEKIAGRDELRHVVLMCSAINAIDASALESLEAINHRLSDAGITLHLSEVKGPVMDRLKRSTFLDDLTGDIFLSQDKAFADLAVRTEDGDSPQQTGDIWQARGLI